MSPRLVLPVRRLTQSAGERAGVRPPYPVTATPASPLGPRLRRRGRGLCITGNSIGIRREVGIITVSTGAEVCMY